MNYLLGPDNWLCRRFGHRFRNYRDRDGVARATCWLDGHTVPPFRKVSQVPGGGYLPDHLQPPGAM